MDRFLVYDLSFKTIFVVVIIFFIGSLFYSQTNLPDFEAYESIFNRENIDIAISGWEPVFMLLNDTLRSFFNLSYTEFRLFLLILSLSFLLSGLYLIHRMLPESSRFELGRYSLSNLYLSILIISSILVFLLEFYLIRLRGGLAISFFVLSVPFFYGMRDRFWGMKLIFATFLWLLAFFTHKQTTIVLTLFILCPMVVALFLVRFRWHRLWISSFAVKTIMFSILSILVLCFIVQLSIARGEHLYSHLNLVRLIALSIIPVFIVFFFWVRGQSFRINHLLRWYKVESRAKNKYSLAEQYYIWHCFMTYVYIYLAFILLILYLLDYINDSGEAMVRVFTLNSVPAIIILLRTTLFQRTFWSFLLVSNSAFFIKTIMG